MDEHVHFQVGSFTKGFVTASEGALKWLGPIVMVKMGHQAISSLESLVTALDVALVLTCVLV